MKISSQSRLAIGMLTAGMAGWFGLNPAQAVPYASGVTNNAGSIFFTLNENANDVKVVFNPGNISSNLGSLTKGQHSFPLGGATSFQIQVLKTNANGFVNPTGAVNTNIFFGATNILSTVTLISDNSNPLLNFSQPRGLAVNRNPKSPYFGRIYVANSYATNTIAGRPLGDGIYMLNADQTDALGLGTNASTAGLDFTTGGTNASPWRISVGQDNNLYICDWSDPSGNLYVTDPNVTTSGFALKQLTGTATVPVGAGNNHGGISSVVVEGFQASNNFKIYTIDEDLQANKTTATLSQLNSLWRYDVNSAALPFNNDPTRMWSPVVATKDGYPLTSQRVDLDRGADGKFYALTYRSSGSESGLTVLSSTGTLLTHSRAASLAAGFPTDVFQASYAVAVAPNQRYVAVARENGQAWILPLTNGVPVFGKQYQFTPFTGTSRNWAVRFDAAGNLYIVNAGTGPSTGNQLVRILSPGNTTLAITSGNNVNANGDFALYEPPVFQTEPQGVTNTAGSNATLSFELLNPGPAATILPQWYFNDVAIAGQTNATLIRTNVQVATLAGYYKVVVTSGPYSITSAPAALVVADSLPVILTQPASHSVNAGTNLTLSVTTIGSDPRTYQWVLNGTNIMGATTSSLTRNNLQAPMGGSYQVLISNAFGAVSSDGNNINITEIIANLNTQPVSRTVSAGSNVTFTAASNRGTDPRDFQWYRGLVGAGTPIANATNTSLVIPNAQVADSDSYYVTVNNSQGTTSSTNAVLTVTDTPNVVFITQPVSQTTGAGNNVTFSGTAFGNNLAYQWFMNGNAIPGATTNTFVWTNALVADTGTNFSLSISNETSGPLSSTNAYLTVTNRAPVISVQPVGVAVSAGSTANFSVTALGQGPFFYQWRLGTNNYGAVSGSSSLSIVNAQLADASTNYSVIVSNAVGTVASAAFQLAVTIPSTTGTGTGLTGEYFANQYLGSASVTNGLLSLTIPPTVSRVDTNIDFIWTGVPDPAVAPDYFVVRWTGQVQPLYSQDYTFSTKSDEGIRLWFNGKLLIDQWRSGGNQNYSVTVSNLVAGQKYDVRVELLEITGTAEAHLYWSSPSQLRTAIPMEQLYPASGPYVIAITPTNVVSGIGEFRSDLFTVYAGGQNITGYQWQKDGVNIDGANNSTLTIPSTQLADSGSYRAIATGDFGSVTSVVTGTLTVTNATTPGAGTGVVGEYFSRRLNTTVWYTNAADLTRTDAAIDFTWGTFPPDVTISGDTNIVRWSGQVEPLYSQVYTFHVATDDGVRLWVDGVLLVDKWVTGDTNANSASVAMAYPFVAGQRYDVRMEYFERSGAAYARLWWSSLNQPKEVVPTSQLYPQSSPFFITQPASQALVSNANTALTVYAGGTGPIFYQWYKNGSPLDGVTGSVLSFPSVQAGDVGTYSLTISNSLGAHASTNAVLTVNIAPFFTQQPVSQTVAPGTPVTFTGLAGGDGTVTYQWKFNGTNISGATDTSYSIGSAVSTNAGNYTLTASSTFGNATSTNAVLTVNSVVAAPPVFAPAVSASAGLILTWNTTSGRTYRLQSSTNLASTNNWVDINPDVVATGSATSFTNAVSGQQKYFRVLLLP